MCAEANHSPTNNSRRKVAAMFKFRLLISCGIVTSFFANVVWGETPILGMAAEPPAVGRFVKTEQGYMVAYKTAIPGTTVEYEMQPIPGGKYLLGSPSAEPGREACEGPQVEIIVEPFWMGTYEVTWGEYKQYMALHDAFKKLAVAKKHLITAANRDYVVTAPSNLYDPTFTFQFGDHPRQPALSMSQFAAKQYTKWFSGVTGRFYRLPTEGEWEYACRAGAATAYSFGDDPAQLKDYGWYKESEDAKEETHKVGEKKPNRWGLFDMHGNVAEWVLDGYGERAYARLLGKTTTAGDAVQWPTKLFPRVVRGGSYADAPQGCRSASRHQSSDDKWRSTDPNFPKSPWWFTDGYGLAVGMRIVRPLMPPPPDQRAKVWEADLEMIREDFTRRIDEEGRGARGVANPELPQAIKEIEGRK